MRRMPTPAAAAAAAAAPAAQMSPAAAALHAATSVHNATGAGASASRAGGGVAPPIDWHVTTSEVRVRCEDGTVLRRVFGADAPVAMVAQMVREQGPAMAGPFVLRVPYPRREFGTEQEMATTLRAAGLAPRGSPPRPRRPLALQCPTPIDAVHHAHTRHPPRSRRTLSRPSSARGRGGGPLGDRPADAAAAAAAGRDARRRTAARRRGELRRDDRVRRARRAGVDGAERGAGCALAHAHRRRGAARARRARRAALLHLLLRPRQGRRHPLPPVWPRLPPRVHRAVAPRQAHLPALQEPRGPAAVVRVISDSLRQSRAIS
mmetsp:Transcript_44999/g.146165  ORF Transcript_44999/g.146165 Transcript_44999/m.146165 type:complete len:320 (+) Transcript_44999:543-1502(+)